MAPTRIEYGDAPNCFGELTVPSGASRGTVVVIHGGFWRSVYGLELGRPLAADLAERGYTAWNLEYRRVGGGGGWPTTLLDVAAGIDRLADIDGVDTESVIAVGHSAGGHLAAWAAGRPGLQAGEPGATPRVRLRGVLSQAGVLDLASAAREHLGGGAVDALLGNAGRDAPDLAASADPTRHIPLDVPLVALHARDDEDVPFSQSSDYVAAATTAGADASLVEVTGDHDGLIDVHASAWLACAAAVERLLP
jgi:acetyl esterase/lipase